MLAFIENRFVLYGFATLLILLTIIILKIFIDKKIIQPESGRKLLHIIAIMACTFVVNYTKERTELAYIFIAFTAILFYIAHKNILIPSDRQSYGIALFPAAFAVLLLSAISTKAVTFGMLTLGISDALAGWAGSTYGLRKVKFLYELKSWLGFVVFFASTVMILFNFISLGLTMITIAFVIALSELFSYRGSDNFTIPIVAAFWFEYLLLHKILGPSFLIFGFIIIIFYLVYKKKWLSESGVVVAILLAAIITFSAGPFCIIPMAIFFIAGSLTSKLHPKTKDANGRDAHQVFANGLVATICIFGYAFTSDKLYLMAFLCSISIALSDTISSDIGTFYKQKTYDILSFKPLEIGLSGGISFAGTAAGFLAAFVFAIANYYLFKITYLEATFIALIGFLGMLVDSFIGSWLQVKYKLQGKIIEEKEDNSMIIKGIAWIDNNAVNLLSNAIVIGIYLIYYKYNP
jgi:uncharacterized protein (TIGR00297 family)